MATRSRFTCGVLLLAVVVCAVPAHAQVDSNEEQQPVFGAVRAASGGLFESALNGAQVVTKPEGAPPTPRHTGIKAMVKDLGADIVHLPSMENLFWAGVGGGLALAIHPADDYINTALIDSPFADKFFGPGKVIGSLPVLLGSATTVYIVGRSKDLPKVSHVGMDLIQALAISELMTQTLKYATGRERPDGSSNNSFPSGHAADTFAVATALERHANWKYAVPAYLVAGYVAVSRLPANRHWASDVVFGSAVGIIAGRTVTRHGREFPVTLNMVPGGAMIAYRRPQPHTPAHLN